ESSSEQPKHAERVQDGFVDAIGREFPEAGEIGLVFKFEGPRDRTLKVSMLFASQNRNLIRYGGDVGGKERPVSVSVFWAGLSRARGTAFRIGFAQDDRRSFPLGERSDDLESTLNGRELITDAHANVTVDESGSALGVKTHKIKRRAVFPRSVVSLARAML